jgi:alpha-tubulin suppressor-like RCC1 family protein
VTARTGAQEATLPNALLVLAGNGPAASATLVQAAEDYSCALDSSAHLWCWGENGAPFDGWSVFGNGDTNSSAEPVLGAGGLALDAYFGSPYSSSHACGISGGRAWCWGANYNGQLGDGTTDPTLVPVPVTGGHQFKAIAIGQDYTCALDNSGRSYCWGLRADGRLGEGTQVDGIQSVPNPVSGGLAFTAIAAADESPTCALDAGGAAYCWGWGGGGALGNGSTATATTPVPVSGGHSFKKISAGRSHFCAISRSDDAYCWGRNGSGQIGNNSSTTLVLTPSLVTGGLKWSQISGGEDHSCGVTLAGDGYCWGENSQGELGAGVVTNAVPVPTPVAGNLKWRMISAGDEHSCGVTVGGDVYCWGSNSDSKVGSTIPDHAIATSPVRVQFR